MIEPTPEFRAALWVDTSYVFTSPQTAISWVQDKHGNRIGFHEWHYCLDQVNAGGVWFDIPAAHEAVPNSMYWDLVSMDPLTVEPSILCRRCGHHGWIREGRWVSA